MAGDTLTLTPDYFKDDFSLLNADYAKQKAKTAAAEGPQGGDWSKGVDPLVIAYFLLLQAVTISSDSSIIHAKLLQSNALSQMKLEDQAKQCQLTSVPHLQTKTHKEKIGHWTWRIWEKPIYYYRYMTFKTHPNQDAVEQAEAQNMIVEGERSAISDRLQVLQQVAQVGQTQVNTLIDESTQEMSEGSNLIQILQSLTFLALLRQPPQG